MSIEFNAEMKFVTNLQYLNSVWKNAIVCLHFYEVSAIKLIVNLCD